MFLLYILGFVFMLGLVILIHEAGHFIMAKRAGILCHEFAIGMGPILYSKKKGETLYSIRAIPIGGFVSMAGEEISDELVKVGDTIRVMFDEQNPDVISHIIINEDDPKYQDALLLNVDTIDLKGKNEAPLYINTYEVKRNAYYVMKDKVLQIAPYERSFESKTLLQRFSTIFAGPFMNFILAFVLFVSIAFIVGLPQTDSTEIASVGG
ncbi:MAG: site-2 protease family protein, partial [Bacillota bacterium]